MLLTSQVGSECFCGDYLTKSHKKSDSECKMACKGKRDQACGDHWRVLIYRNPYYRCKLLFLLKLSLELSIIHFFLVGGGFPSIMIKNINFISLYWFLQQSL